LKVSTAEGKGWLPGGAPMGAVRRRKRFGELHGSRWSWKEQMWRGLSSVYKDAGIAVGWMTPVHTAQPKESWGVDPGVLR
jgi:hypothetical protein